VSRLLPQLLQTAWGGRWQTSELAGSSAWMLQVLQEGEHGTQVVMVRKEQQDLLQSPGYWGQQGQKLRQLLLRQWLSCQAFELAFSAGS